MASIKARDFVRDTLRSPSTASFPQRGKVASHPGCAFTVSGQVDAQNGFGATVREYYSVTIRYDAKKDAWLRQ